MKKKIISILLEDSVGALSRVVELFGSRGYNLHSICSGGSREEGLQRLTLNCFESENNMQRIVKLLENIIYVYEVKQIDANKSILRELILVKIKIEKKNLQKIVENIQKFDGVVRWQNQDFICFEYLGNGKKIDEMLHYFRINHNIIEISRSGEVALAIS